MEAVLGTGLFDYDEAESSAGRIRELQGEHTPETEEYGITSFVYRTAQPFDARKLWQFLHTPENFSGMLGSRGFFWVAADHRIAFEWAHAGDVNNVTAFGMWWGVVARESWEQLDGKRLAQKPDWDRCFGVNPL